MFAPMALEDATMVSAEHREYSEEQLDASLVDGQAIVSTEATSEQDSESDDENPSGDIGENRNTSDNGGHMKIGAEAALAGLSYDFGWSKITQGHIASLGNSARYFPKGFGRPPDIEYVLNPKENEVVVFKDFFITGHRIPPHPVLLEILHKFLVQLHHTTRKMIYCNTWDPLLFSAGNSSRYQ
jgi:hypothetical protein